MTRCIISIVTFSFVLLAAADALKVGVGIADITGPAGEVPMMGYAEASQKTAGIHTRLFARAFVFRDSNSNSAVFVNVEAGMISQMLKLRVVELLQKKLPGLYDINNIILSATHTHSGPGGFHGYTLYAIAALGYMKDTFDAFSQGITQSIIKAHMNMRSAKLMYGEGQLFNSNINRSPSSYLKNPRAERERYNGNVDHTMQVVKVVDTSTNAPFAMLNWFPVHCTSMNNTNLMISSDNKGWAAQLFERLMDNGQTLPGKNKFIAAFSNANEGDVSPNTAGPRCTDTGEPCDILTSACGGSAKHCIASGPGRDMMDSNRIIGMKQFHKAKELFDNSTEVHGDKVQVVHQNVDMSNYQVEVNGRQVKTCKPSMGYSFAAGTTDGPGGFDFTQGETSGNKFWNLVRNILSKPSDDDIKCQHPKPILLNTGGMTFPTAWQPSIVETQIVRIGDLVLVALPGEFTTMSGRRVKEAVQNALTANGITNAKVILCGLSNLYTSYITTNEEYHAQRYEAASTIYGPHTLSAYVSQFSKLAKALAQGAQVSQGPQVPNFYEKIKGWSFVTPVVYDTVGINQNFGDVVQQPKAEYTAGSTVQAKFRTGHPRNNMMLGRSFMLVQRKSADGSWQDVCNDACVETRFHWIRTNGILGRSEAHLEWDIPACAQAGTYRIQHIGNYKSVLVWEPIKQFKGTSREFQVKNSPLLRQARRYSVDVVNASVGSGCQ